MKKFFIALLAGGLTFFLLGGLVYGVALSSIMEAHTIAPEGYAKESPEWIWLILGNLGFAALISYVFIEWAQIKTASTGFRGGFVIGLFVAITWDFTQYSMSNIMDMTGVLIDIIVFTIIGGMVGAVIGWVLGILDR